MTNTKDHKTDQNAHIDIQVNLQNRRALFLKSQLYFSHFIFIMLNKNVADYTNFDGKTNKKITQSPGGASSFSLAWNNEKTDYGPERVLKKKNNYPTYNEEPHYTNNGAYQEKGNFNYNEPIRVMEEKQMQEMRSEQIGYPQRQDTYASNTQANSAQGNRKVGGEYGYNNYPPQDQGGFQKAKQQEYYQQDSLDTKLEEHGKTKNSFSRPPQPPQNGNQQRACIKIHDQKTNNIIGDNSYNYWKDSSDDRKYSNQSNKRPNLNEQPRSQEKPQQPVYQQKTSVKVHNPPGGRSNFTFG